MVKIVPQTSHVAISVRARACECARARVCVRICDGHLEKSLAF